METINSISSSKTKTPLVTVVVPVYNGAKYVIEAVESIQNNTFKDFEVMLVNDGSPADNSAQICGDLAKKYSNIRFTNFEKNRGLAEVINYCIKNANGKYIARLNQDDIMLPNRLQEQVNFLNNNPSVVVVGSWITLFKHNGEEQILEYMPNDTSIKKTWYFVGPFSDPTTMYRRDTALKIGLYEQKYWPADDSHFWFKMGHAGKLANIQHPLVRVRWHDDAGSLVYARKMAVSLYNARMDAHKHHIPASFHIRMYWVVQMLAGLILPPKFVWVVFRLIKRTLPKLVKAK
ncbi:MAG: glycosyltransferase [Patescibacteria group bacterium]